MKQQVERICLDRHIAKAVLYDTDSINDETFRAYAEIDYLLTQVWGGR